MSSKDEKRYEKWLKSDDCKRNLIKKMEKSGVPLELRTKTLLENLEFRCSKFPYHDITETGDFTDTVVRELDIRATKVNQYPFKIGPCEVVYRILLFVECKSIENTDIIFFDKDRYYLPTFPVKFSGNELLYNTYKNYKFPAIINKFIEVENADNVKNYNRLREGCHQLLNACKYQYHRILQQNVNLRNLRRLFHAKYPSNTREEVDDVFSLDDILEEIRFFSVDVGFPILVINHDMGLIRAKFDDSTGTITDFNNVGFGIYSFDTEHAYKYEELLNSTWDFPVIITNLDFLDKCIETIQEGIEITIKNNVESLRINPMILKNMIIEEAFKFVTWEPK